MWEAKREYTPDKKLIAIVMDNVGGRAVGKKFEHGIKDTTNSKSKFCRDMHKRFPQATHVNFYDKETGLYKEQILLSTGDHR